MKKLYPGKNLLILLLLFSPLGIFSQCPGLNFNVAPSQAAYCGVPSTVQIINSSTGVDALTSTYEYYRNAVLFNTLIGVGTVPDGIGTAGTYNYSVIAITTGGCRDTITFSVQVITAPNPSFTFTPANSCVGTLITFTNTSGGIIPGTIWTWDFGDGSPVVNTLNSTHTYASTGTFVVTLTQNNGGGCITSVTQNVVVSPPPTASFTFSPNNQCPHTPITFTNTSTGLLPGVTYAWNFGDGNTSTLQSPVHTYSYPGGVFLVTLTVTNPGGCVSTTSQNVTVLPSPNINISGDDGDGDLIFCLSVLDTNTIDFVTFTNNTVGGNPNTWDFGDGSPIVTTTGPGTTNHNYTSFGTFTVIFTSQAGPGGCISRDTLYVIFDKQVVASFAIPLAEQSGCLPHSVTPINHSINANLFTWNFGDGTPPVVTNSYQPPTHIYTTPGNFSVSLTAANGCTSTTITFSSVVVGGPPVIIFNPLPNPGCSPQMVTMNNTSTGVAPNTNYWWNFGHGIGDTLRGVRNPPPQLYTQGTWTITLIAGNTCGRDTLQHTIQIDTVPTLNLVIAPTNGCTPLTVTATNNSFGQNVTHQWWIDGGLCCPVMPNYTTANIPPQVFTAPIGNNSVIHTIRYRITNHCGFRDTTITIRVHPLVVANFNASPLILCAGGNVTFSQSSQGDSLTWAWDFGNGNTANTAGPHTQTYNTPGFYNAQLIVDGYCGRDTLVRVIEVRPYPTVTFVPVPDSGCVPLTVNFTNTSTPGGTYNWNFGAGAAPPTFVGYTPGPILYSTIGTKTITLTVNLNGCIASNTAQVQVNPKPAVAFTATPMSGCSPLVVTFNNTTPAVGGETWFWDFGDGTNTNAQNPGTHTYVNGTNATITQNVKLVVTNSFGCADSLTRTITIYPLPVASFTSDAPKCVGQTVNFTNTSTGASNYNWNFGDGFTSVAVNPSHSYTGNGSFNVTLIAITSFGCRDTIVNPVMIDSIPGPAFVADTVCIGNVTTFTDMTSGAPVIWAWTFGDGNTSAIQNPTNAYAAPGVYNVKLIVTNSVGCPDSITIPVLIRPVPIANFNAPPACFTSPSLFTDVSSGGPNQWNWDFGDGNISTIQNPTNVYASPGTYNVTLIVITGVGCSDTITIQHIVNPIPTPDFTFTTECFLDTTRFTSTSLGGPDTFTWIFGDGNTDNTNNPSPGHYYNLADTFNVTMIAGYASTGCVDTITYPVIVNPTPVSSFNANTACVNDTTFFSDLSTNNPNTWTWDFADGSPQDNNQNPTHIFPAPATYNVLLVSQNSFGCLDSVIQPVTINPRPVPGFTADTVCQDLSTSLTDISIASVSWEYDWGDGTPFDTIQNPTHIYANAGTYIVRQVVWNSFGCPDTVVNSVVVNPLPVSAFTATTSCFGYATQFTDQSQNPVSWSWDFGDATGTSSQQNPIYTYGNDSTWNVTLIVNNSFGCADTITQPVIVLPIPIAGFSSPVVCAGVSVQFTDTTQNNPNAWSWDFGDGSPLDTLQNPSHVYAPGAIYTVTFIAGNSSGCYDTLVTNITVNTVPVPVFTVDTVCLGLTTSFVNNSTDPNPMNFVWDFGDGNNSFAINPGYIYADSGNYIATLYSYNNWGCVDSVSHPVYVPPVPTAGFFADTVCTGYYSTFIDTSSSFATSWSWDFGDGGTSNVQNPSYSFATTGNHTITLTVTTQYGCTGFTTQNVVSLDAPVAGFNFPSILCEDRVISFTDNSFNNPNVWSWNFGDGGTSNNTNPTHTFATAGNYSVQLVVTNAGGCSDTMTVPLVLNPNPVADFMADTICIGAPTLFTDQSSGSGITTWFWDFDNNNNTSQSQNPGYIFFDSSGIYNVMLIVTTNQGCTDTITNPVWITPLPNAAFTSNPNLPSNFTLDNPNITFTNLSTNSISWLWNFGDGTTSTLQDPTHAWTSTGNYCITLVAYGQGGCADTTFICSALVMSGTPIIPNTFTPNGDGVNDFFEIPNISLWPNNHLIVYNRWGNLVYEKDQYNNEWNGTFYKTGDALPDGGYFYVLTPGNGLNDMVGDVVIFR